MVRLTLILAVFMVCHAAHAERWTVIHAGTLIAELPMAPEVLTLDTEQIQIRTTAALEGQVTTAGIVDSARILDGTGAHWADATVTDEAGSGDIKLQDTNLQAGAFARITSAVFQG